MLAPTKPVRLERVGSVVKLLEPENVLLSPRSVVEATTMLAVPLKETPLIVRAVWRAVAVAALPPMESVEVDVCTSAVPAALVYRI